MAESTNSVYSSYLTADDEISTLLSRLVSIVLLIAIVWRLVFSFTRRHGSIYEVSGISQCIVFKYDGEYYTVSHAWKPLVFTLDRVIFSRSFKNYYLDVACTSKPNFAPLSLGNVVVCHMAIGAVVTKIESKVRVISYMGKNFYSADFGIYYGSSGSPVYLDLFLVGVYGYQVLYDGIYYSLLQEVSGIMRLPFSYSMSEPGIFRGKTGSGKTNAMILFIKQHMAHRRFVVVSPSVFLLEQMVARFIELGVRPRYSHYKGNSRVGGTESGHINVLVTTAFDHVLEPGSKYFIDEWDHQSAEYRVLVDRLVNYDATYISATDPFHSEITLSRGAELRYISMKEIGNILSNASIQGKSVMVIVPTISSFPYTRDFNFKVITSENSEDFSNYPLWLGKDPSTVKHTDFVITTSIARRGIAVKFDIFIDVGLECVVHIENGMAVQKIVPISYATAQQSYGRLAGRSTGWFYFVKTDFTIGPRSTNEVVELYYRYKHGLPVSTDYDVELLSRIRGLPYDKAEATVLLALHNSVEADRLASKMGIELRPAATRHEELRLMPFHVAGKYVISENVLGFPVNPRKMDISIKTSGIIIISELVIYMFARYIFGRVRVVKTSRWFFFLDIPVLIAAIWLDILYSNHLFFGVGYVMSAFFTTWFSYSRVALFLGDYHYKKMLDLRPGVMLTDIVVYGFEPLLLVFIVPFIPVIIGMNMVFALLLVYYAVQLSESTMAYIEFTAAEIRELIQLKPVAADYDGRLTAATIRKRYDIKSHLPIPLMVKFFLHETYESRVEFRVYALCMICSNIFLGEYGSILLYAYVFVTAFPIVPSKRIEDLENLHTVYEYQKRAPPEWMLLIHPIIGLIYNNAEFFSVFFLR